MRGGLVALSLVLAAASAAAACDVPPHFVNDDYCDCPDGSDEPRTAACAHVAAARFECANAGYLAASLPASRVGDGVCDCCDGSDEPANTCEPTCAALGAEALRAARARLDDVESGFELRRAALAASEAGAEVSADELKSTAKLLSAQENFVARLKLLLRREERTEEAQRTETARAAAYEQYVRAHDRLAEEVVIAEEGLAEELGLVVDEPTAAADDAPAETKTKTTTKRHATDDILDEEIDMSDGGAMELREYMDLAALREGDPYLVHSESRQDKLQKTLLLGPLINNGEEGARRALELGVQAAGLALAPVRVCFALVRAGWRALGSPAAALVAAPGDALWAADDAAMRWLGRTPATRPAATWLGVQRARLRWAAYVAWDAAPYFYSYAFPATGGRAQRPEVLSLKRVVRRAERELRALEKKKDAVQTKLKADYGLRDLFLPLADECFSLQVQQYSYRFCPFSDVTQDGTKLGKWGSWVGDDYREQLYDRGSSCYKAGPRKTRVALSCGVDNALVSVAEPETCVYAVEFETPLACGEEEVEEARALVESLSG